MHAHHPAACLPAVELLAAERGARRVAQAVPADLAVRVAQPHDIRQLVREHARHTPRLRHQHLLAVPGTLLR